MQYRDFGNTGLRISALGFGAMRLPERDGHVEQDRAIEMLHRAFELGVNYVDTAYFYSHDESEIVVGRALKGWIVCNPPPPMSKSITSAATVPLASSMA